MTQLQPDFLGAFAVLETAQGILMVQNQRQIAGVETLTWDLPGGRVEQGETLAEALRRELQEETQLHCASTPEFLFYQEGQRLQQGRRSFAWRSFFYAVPQWHGEAVASSEVLDLRWLPRSQMQAELKAPYHDSFLRWLEHGGREFQSLWQD